MHGLTKVLLSPSTHVAGLISRLKIDTKLKLDLLGKITKVYDSIPVYTIRKLSVAEIEENAKYYASKFMGSSLPISFSSKQREEDSTLINLPWNTQMRIYYDSNSITIKRKLNLMENLIKEEYKVKQQIEIVTSLSEKLRLDKFRLHFEEVKLENVSQIKASGTNIEGKNLPIVICRIIAIFRRFINTIPVYGVPSIFLRIAADNLVDSIGIDWRHIEEKPIEYPRIIKPEIAAEKILENLSNTVPDKTITSDDYVPLAFTIGYLSMPKRWNQTYMQPVYIAKFKPLGHTTLDPILIVPATTYDYEHISVTG
jgi:hypothetical protein